MKSSWRLKTFIKSDQKKTESYIKLWHLITIVNYKLQVTFYKKVFEEQICLSYKEKEPEKIESSEISNLDLGMKVSFIFKLYFYLRM